MDVSMSQRHALGPSSVIGTVLLFQKCGSFLLPNHFQATSRSRFGVTPFLPLESGTETETSEIETSVA